MAAEPSVRQDVARRVAAARTTRAERAGDVRMHRTSAMRARAAAAGPAHVGRGQDWTDPTADSPLADENTLRLEHVVSALAGRRRTFYERYVKHALDRAVALVLVVLLLPVLTVTALAVLVTLGSPIVFRQERVGRGGRRFAMYKFRTMKPDLRRWQCPNYRGPERRHTHKTSDDPRHTRLGRRLRKSSIDELPQLFNVLRGDMSLIGPRPELVQIVTHYRGWQHARHAVKPGITGLWQVTERANGGLMHECVELDLAYVERLSLRSDLAILFKTPFALLRRDRVV